MRFSASVRVDAPAERVWDLLEDWDRSSEWMIGTTVEVLGERGQGVGARTHAVTTLAGLKLIDIMTVTRWEPPSLVEVRHERWPLQGTAWFRVQADGAGARVDWVEDINVPFGLLGRIVARIARGPVQWGLRASLKRLTRLVESSS
jgi:carbon monoxide dehydrogenase subunit G